MLYLKNKNFVTKKSLLITQTLDKWTQINWYEIAWMIESARCAVVYTAVELWLSCGGGAEGGGVPSTCYTHKYVRIYLSICCRMCHNFRTNVFSNVKFLKGVYFYVCYYEHRISISFPKSGLWKYLTFLSISFLLYKSYETSFIVVGMWHLF